MAIKYSIDYYSLHMGYKMTTIKRRIRVNIIKVSNVIIVIIKVKSLA